MVTRTACLKDFRTDRYSGSGLHVQVLAEDHVGTYILPFPCQHINGECRNGTTGGAIQASILGWREVPTRGRDRNGPDQQSTKA